MKINYDEDTIESLKVQISSLELEVTAIRV